MAVVEVNLPQHRYRVVIEPGLLPRLGALVREAAPHGQAALLADRALGATHGAAVESALRAAGYRVLYRDFPAGEDHKNLDTVRDLYTALLDAHLERGSPVVALGGGVVTDTAGFVAATYLRGVPLVTCPTTLLAMVDAAVGGKTGVNVPQGKNLIGSFYQPRLVAIDPEVLATLPVRELRGGLAECVKHGVIRDPELFEFIERNVAAILRRQTGVLGELVERNVRIKAAVVMADEKEAGERAHLNFGHSFGHAIEATCPGGLGAPGSYQHGEAVALGMVAATGLAVQMGRCPPVVLERLTALLGRIGLPTRADDLAPVATLLDSMRRDKKVAGGRVRLVLPDRLGAVSIVADTPDAALAGAWEALGAR
jgi:3-dehydroquinate synthase